MSFLQARKNAGLTQAVVAEKLGITAASVCQWETGKNLPRAEKLPEIATLYGCAVNDLLSDNPASESSTD